MTRTDAEAFSPAAAPALSPGRPPVPNQRIIEAALQIVDEDGAEALTMRSLAARLNSSTATLYRHFPNRAALIAAVFEHVVGELDLDSLEGPWRRWCEGFITGWFGVMSRHRNVAMLMIDQLPFGPNSMAAKESWLTVLLASGFPPAVAARSMATLGHYVHGFALQLGGERASSDHDEVASTTERIHVDRERYPALAAALDAGDLPVSLNDEFLFGMKLILDSLERLRDES